MSGAFKYLGSLNPILLYTFDRDYTYQLGDTTYYINKSDYDAPLLQVADTHLFRSNSAMPVITPSLSLTETMTRYKSFSSGNLSLMNIRPYYLAQHSGTSKYDKIYYNDSLNESTRCAKDVLSPDTISTINSNGIYSIIFHIDFRYMYPSTSSTFYQRTLNHHGTISYQKFDDGIESDQYYTTTNQVNSYNEKTVFFRVMDILLHITANTQSTANIHYTNVDGTFSKMNLVTITMNAINIIKLEVNKSTNIVKLSVGDYFTTTFPYTNASDNSVVQFGFNTAMYATTPPYSLSDLYVPPLVSNSYPPDSINTTINTDDVVSWYGMNSNGDMSLTPNARIGSFYKIYTTDIEVRLDNIAVFNRSITDAEFQRYYSLHNDLVTHYVKKGFIELYDFKRYYEPITPRCLLDKEYLIADSINYVNNMLMVKNEGNYNDVYVMKHHDGVVEYSLYLSSKSMIYEDYSHTYTYPYYYKKLIRNRTFTITFMFKTKSNDGNLFSYYDRRPLATNMYIKFVNGNLQLMLGTNVVKAVSGYNDGKFHQIAIQNGVNTFSLTVDNTLIYSTNSMDVYNYDSAVFIGNMHPTFDGLELNIAMLAYAPVTASTNDIYNIYNNTVFYDASGVITLNNIRVGVTVLIYNDNTGELIEKLKSDSIDGTFKYYNRYPYTITVIVNDDTLMNGRSYIVSPVEII